MKINTTRFGEIDVDESTFFNFSDGLLGFPDIHQYVILDVEDSPFKWMQAVEKPEVAFVICDPMIFMPDYQVQVTRHDQNLLKLKDLSEGVVAVIIRIPEDPQKMTANMLGPIVFNPVSRLAKQIVLVDPNYSTKMRIFKDENPK